MFKEGFSNPPAQAHPKVYWWWLNGNVDTSRLKEEMLSMKNTGITGFDIFEIGVPKEDSMIPAGPAFMGTEFLNAVKVVINEAGKLGMEAGFNMASSWNAGGSWTAPENAAKSIYFSKIIINEKTGKIIKLPFPEIPRSDKNGNPLTISFAPDGKPVFHKEIAVLAIPVNRKSKYLDTAEIINLSESFNPETEELDWNLSGEWEIHRYICSNSGEQLKLPSLNSAGPIIDHFDANATEAHFQYIINKLKSVIGDFENTALKSLYLASYEATEFAWTTTLPAEFKKINGYDVYKLIPALFNPNIFSPETTRNFKSGFSHTLSELMISNFYKKAREIANNHGLKINSESGGPGQPLHNVPAEPLKALGALDLPRGEFWINHNRLNEKGIDILRVVKEVSAASHIYNRGIVEEEAFTSFQHWQEGPFDMKPYGDRAFCEGMNRAVMHGFSHNPSGTGYPGYVYHAGTHFNDKRVWWPKVKPFTEYLSRISFILQEADFTADVLYYYGDKVPNYAGHKNSRFTVGPGYDYEVVNTEIMKELTVQNGKLVLPGGAQFSILVLEPEDEINPEVLIKLKNLAGQGAIIVGSKPIKMAAPPKQTDTKTVENLLDNLWLDLENKDLTAEAGKGRILAGIRPSQVLETIDVPPDLSYSDRELFTLDYIHYLKDDLDFYLVRNTTDKWLSRNCGFRQQNKVPEIWNPVSGKIVPVAIYNQETDYINIPLTLAPYGTLFVVFRENETPLHYTRIEGDGQHPPLVEFTCEGIRFLREGIFELRKQDQLITINNSIKTQTLDGAWEVFFPEGWGAPERIIFPDLISWTKSEHEGIKYFSGTATYKKTFQHDIHSSMKKNRKIYLDLGDISKVGEVWLNDRSLGITWAEPYRFDITNILRDGDNILTVEISNTWSNRLAGDAVTGEKNTNTNIETTNIKGLNKVYVPWAEVPLIKSGLLGPVTIETTQLVE